MTIVSLLTIWRPYGGDTGVVALPSPDWRRTVVLCLPGVIDWSRTATLTDRPEA